MHVNFKTLRAAVQMLWMSDRKEMIPAVYCTWQPYPSHIFFIFQQYPDELQWTNTGMQPNDASDYAGQYVFQEDVISTPALQSSLRFYGVKAISDKEFDENAHMFLDPMSPYHHEKSEEERNEILEELCVAYAIPQHYISKCKKFAIIPRALMDGQFFKKNPHPSRVLLQPEFKLFSFVQYAWNGEKH